MRKAIKKDSSIFISDTIKVVDTVYFEVARIDTVFKYKMDTVEFWRDSVHIKYHYSYQDSLVYIDVDCPENQIITKTNTVTNVIELKPTFWQKLEYFGAGVLGLIALLVFGWFIKKFYL